MLREYLNLGYMRRSTIRELGLDCHRSSLPITAVHIIDVSCRIGRCNWLVSSKRSFTEYVDSLGCLRVLTTPTNVVHSLYRHEVTPQRIVCRTLRLVSQRVLLESVIM